jgi:hypothetical protein
MHRLTPVLALILLLPASLFAGGDEQTVVCKAALVSFSLLDDAEVNEDEEGFVAVSQSADLMVLISQTSEFIPPNEMSEGAIAETLGVEELIDFEYTGLTKGPVVYVYGEATIKDGDGDSWHGFFGIFLNEEAPEQSYVLAIISPLPMSKKSRQAAQMVIDTLEGSSY